MMNRKRVVYLSLAVLAASTPLALAGTKYQANVVPASASNPPANPTLTTKGKIQVSDSAKMQASIKGVTDGAGAPANSSTAYVTTLKTHVAPVLDGTEYIAILKGNFAALNISFELPIPIDVKNGNGGTTLALPALTSLIPPGTGRSIEITGAEIWGPLGAANAASCVAIVGATPPVGYVLNDPACRGGTKIGVAGVNLP